MRMQFNATILLLLQLFIIIVSYGIFGYIVKWGIVSLLFYFIERHVPNHHCPLMGTLGKPSMLKKPPGLNIPTGKKRR